MHDTMTTGVPMPPGNFELQEASNRSLILTWDRPSNMPSVVDIIYFITMSSLEEREPNFEETFNTSALSLSINTTGLVKSTTCQLFQFIIQGQSLAGIGHMSPPIIDTVPICKLKTLLMRS